MKAQIPLSLLVFLLCLNSHAQNPATSLPSSESLREEVVREFDLQTRALEIRFKELEQKSGNQLYIILGSAAGILILCGLGWSEARRFALKAVENKIEKVVDQRIDYAIHTTIDPKLRRGVREEFRERIDDLNRSASFFSYEETIRKEQMLLILGVTKADRDTMARLLSKLRFENIRTSPLVNPEPFQDQDIVIFADPGKRMDNNLIEKFLEKKQSFLKTKGSEVIYIYYGPNDNHALRPHLSKFTASNNRHTLYARILEAARFRDQFGIGTDDDLMG